MNATSQYNSELKASALTQARVSFAAVVLTGFATYILTLGYQFAFDDQAVIPISWQMGTESFFDVLRAPVQAKTVVLPYFRPIVALSYWLDGSMWQGNPGGFHLTNLLLHVTVTLLVLVIARRVLPPGPAPLFAGLLFAVHPVHVEAVAWIQGRVDLLASTGTLLAIVLGVDGTDAHGRGRYLRWSGSLIAFFGALLSKEVAIMTPFLLALVLMGDPDQRRHHRIRAAIPLLAAMGAAILLYLGVRASALGSGILGHSDGPPLLGRSLLALRVIPTALRLLIWPIDLNPTHTLPPLSGVVDAHLLLGVLLLAMIVGACICAWRRAGIGIGLAWLALAWLPTSNLIPLSGFVVAERYLYLPSVGLCLAAAGISARMCEGNTHWRQTIFAALAGLLITLSVVAAVQAELWRDGQTFYEGLVRRNPGSSLAHNNLGEVYLTAGDDSKAEREFQEALHLQPMDAAALSNLGLVAQRRGNMQEARRLYGEALTVRPNHAEAWNNLGTTYEVERDWARAAAAYREAVRLAPTSARFLGNLADVLVAGGKPEEAAPLLKEAIRLDPSSLRWRTALQALPPAKTKP